MTRVSRWLAGSLALVVLGGSALAARAGSAPACTRLVEGPRYPRPIVARTGPVLGSVRADLDGDGRPDVGLLSVGSAGRADVDVVSMGGAGNVALRRLATFDAPDASAPAELLAGDVDGDGRPDLVVWWRTAAGLRVDAALARGDTYPVRGTTEFAGAYVALLADIDGDHRTELILIGSGSGVDRAARFVVGTGWVVSATAATWGDGASWTTADIDGDGCADLLTSSPRSSALRVRAGDTSGAWQREFSAPLAYQPGQLIRVPGSGRDDVVVLSCMPPVEAHRLRYEGLGSWSESWSHALPRTPGNVGSRNVVADLNGDGRVDLAFGLDPAERGFFTLNAIADAVPFDGPMHADGAMLVDVMVTPGGALRALLYVPSGGVTTLPVEPDGRLGDPTLLFPDDGLGMQHLLTSEIDGDGTLDLVATALWPTMQRVTLYRGNGDGSFEARRVLATPIPHDDMFDADLDADGTVDLIVRSAWPSGGGLACAHGLQGGDFSWQVITREPTFRVSVGDLDGDGRVDLLAVTAPGAGGTSTLVPWLARGSGFTRGPLTVITGLVATLGIDSAAGHVVYVIESGRTAWRSILAGGELGTEHLVADVGPSSNPRLVAADLDEDGTAEWGLQRNLPGGAGVEFVVLRRTEDGSLAPAGTESFVAPAQAAALLDLDGDGHLDLLGLADTLQFHRGNGMGGFEPTGTAWALRGLPANFRGRGIEWLGTGTDLSRAVTTLVPQLAVPRSADEFPPDVTLSIQRLEADTYRLAAAATDDCRSAHVTRRVVGLLRVPPQAAVVVVKAADEFVAVLEDRRTRDRRVVLSGPDAARSLARWAVVREHGGFDFAQNAALELRDDPAYTSPPASTLPRNAANSSFALAQFARWNGTRWSRIEVHHPSERLTIEVRATDQAGRNAMQQFGLSP